MISNSHDHPTESYYYPNFLDGESEPPWGGARKEAVTLSSFRWWALGLGFVCLCSGPYAPQPLWEELCFRYATRSLGIYGIQAWCGRQAPACGEIGEGGHGERSGRWLLYGGVRWWPQDR